eukprot:771848-Lingulodinium_polyedra.AAC.1
MRATSRTRGTASRWPSWVTPPSLERPLPGGATRAARLCPGATGPPSCPRSAARGLRRRRFARP